jgi:hypothetical protein
MGCSQSQAVVVQATKTENSHMHPTIFMVGEKSLQMLRELGELKFYQLAQYNEVENTATSPHYDFAAQLENPIQYFRDEESKGSNYEVTKRSACKIKTNYLISNSGLTEQGSGNDVTNLSGNLPGDLANEITKTVDNSPITLAPSSLRHTNNAFEIEITEKNTRIPPILLSTTFPSHSKTKGKITALNQLSPSPSHERRKAAASPKNHRKELNEETSATTSKTSSAMHSLDEIVSVPDESCTTPTIPSNEENATAKTKTKTLFGRNRVMPKRDISDKYDVNELGTRNS